MNYFGKYNRNLRQLDAFKIFSLVLLLSNCWLTYIIVKNLNLQKIIIAPPAIYSEFEVVGNSYSKSYFEQIGKHISNALMTVSPYNIDYSFDSIQGYFSTDPSEIKAIKKFLLKKASIIKKNNIYQSYYPTKVIVNEKHNKFSVEGLLKVSTGSLNIEERKAIIDFKYKILNKRIIIKEFEVK